jgi:hypothetical protein
MAKAVKSALSNFIRWSVIEWSVQFELLTLDLMRFIIISKEDEETCYRARWSFVRPSRVKFSDFTASTKAVIQEIRVSAPAKGLTTYRFEFENNSFIEIEARGCSTVEW